MSAIGGLMSGWDARKREIAQAAAREGLQAGGLGGAIESLGNVENNYYANQMMSPLVEQQYMQQQLEQQRAQATAAKQAEQAALFKQQQLLANQRESGARQRVQMQLDARAEQEARKKQLEDIKRANEYSKQIASREHALRAQSEKKFAVFSKARNIVETMGRLLGGKNEITDTTLVTLYFKTLDPNSQVTEGEVKTLMAGSAIPEAIKSAVRNGWLGGKLNDKQRISIYDAAVKRLNVLRKENQGWIDFYTKIAEDEGLDLDRILPKMNLSPIDLSPPDLGLPALGSGRPSSPFGETGAVNRIINKLF